MCPALVTTSWLVQHHWSSWARFTTSCYFAKTVHFNIGRGWYTDGTSLDVLVTEDVTRMYRPHFSIGKTEASNAEVGQVIDCRKCGSFLKPNMASKNDARHGIELSQLWIIRCHVWHRFLTLCLASKSWYVFMSATPPQKISTLNFLHCHVVKLQISF